MISSAIALMPPMVRNRLSPAELRRIGRFLMAGGFAALVNWGTRFPLSDVMPFGAAVVVSYGIAMVVGFFLYRAFVFEARAADPRGQVWRFVIVNLIGAAEVWLIAVGLASKLAPAIGWTLWVEPISHAIAIGIGAATSYLGHRLLTFRGV